ncbi:MAG: hypothetical protein KatS3mg131_1126 [Candidatus Tectimicrobiota bacterium]|nr:MAG: hypothetical protein KatS3mg131_1126 [Candidatus Tectomicrobia bacterium]
MATLMIERQKAQAHMEEAQRQLAALDRELERLNRERDQKHKRLIAKIEKTVETTFAQEDLLRIIHHAQRVRRTLGHFRQAMLEMHVRRIERLILEGFRHLLHKETLVQELTIDPRQCTIELRGA